ncbi:hypothetical protein [Weissella confusa]|uniref:hypothetical protein n=1 Tax=Weissella confusa TaxID=1583 RepID=UPI00107F9F57|nr:hypothetical protein [Weissella confusa]TGE63787.1 hypothetical protein C6P17_09145 [Weissella confusa]
MIYFDNASTSFPKPVEVIQGVQSLMENSSGNAMRTTSTEKTDGADVKIMDRLFWHREVPHSENFSKPGFQLKTA